MDKHSTAAPKDVSFFFEGGDVGVLLIHGLTGTPVQMRYLGKGLHKAGYTVYGLQLPGHCGTEADLRATGWRDWYAGVEHALEDLQKKVKTVVVGGLSMGAVLSLHLAAQRPKEVGGLLLYGTTLAFDGFTIPWYSFLLRLLNPLLDTPIARNYRFVEQPPYGLKDQRLRQMVADAMHSGSSAEAGLAGMPGASLREFYRLVDVVKPALSAVKAPALLLHAREDDVSSAANSIHLLKHLGGPAELVLLNDSYHMITIDRQRNEVLTRSVEHLRRISVLKPAANSNLAAAAY